MQDMTVALHLTATDCDHFTMSTDQFTLYHVSRLDFGYWLLMEFNIF